MATRPVARLLSFWAALLIGISLVTGMIAGSAMTGGLPADGRTLIGAHLAGLMGGFWMLGLAYTLPMLRFGEVGQRRLAWATIIPNVGNWLITTVKAFLHVVGVSPTGEGRNDAVFGALTAVVVLPSMIAVVAWAWALRRPRS